MLELVEQNINKISYNSLKNTEFEYLRPVCCKKFKTKIYLLLLIQINNDLKSI